MIKKILAIDDSSSMRESVTFFLQDAGFEVLKAVDGLDGLEKIKQERVKLIITDINMPNMDGITFIGEIRRNPLFKYIPIIVLTTESAEDKKEKAKEAGATAWITKPFKPDKLLEIVNKLLK